MKFLYTLALATLLFPLNKLQGQTEIKEGGAAAFLLGDITTADLKRPPYSGWFTPGKSSYRPQAMPLSALKTSLRDLEFVLFLGTWCGDSKREVPRMLKLLEAAGVSEDNIRMIALDRRPGKYKTSPQGLEKKYGIKRVPTLIVLKNGREINRIVERPWATLEEDLLRISQQESYQARYSR
jgi:thiol-disulfide isomerase/thioredoxin